MFCDLKDLLKALKKEYDPENADSEGLDKLMTPERPILVDVSRTPFESLFGPGDPVVNYGDPSEPYVVTGWGETVGTPSGMLPRIILLVRKDAYDKVNPQAAGTAVPPPVVNEPEKPKLGKLNWDGWKPAPGFEDFRK